MAAAQKEFERAAELHRRREYRAAAAGYLAAYRLYPAPLFLYDAAQVYRLAGDRKRALLHYRRYLELEPDGPGAVNARMFAAELAAQHEPKDHPGAARPSSPVRASGNVALVRLRDARPAQSTSRAAAPGRAMRISGLTAVGLGAALMLVGGGFALRARSAHDDLDGYRGMWSDERDAQWDRGERAEQLTGWCVTAGASAAVLGTALLWFGMRREARSRWSVRSELGSTTSVGLRAVF